MYNGKESMEHDIKLVRREGLIPIIKKVSGYRNYYKLYGTMEIKEDNKLNMDNFGYCTTCKTVKPQKIYPMTYNKESAEHRQEFECLHCHRIKIVYI